MLPTSGAHDSTGLTYLPRIHIYRDTHISPPCSNPRSAPPSQEGRFLLWGSTPQRWGAMCTEGVGRSAAFGRRLSLGFELTGRVEDLVRIRDRDLRYAAEF